MSGGDEPGAKTPLLVVYLELRRAHVERHADSPDRAVLYRTLNYDLAGRHPGGRFRRRGPIATFREILRARPRRIELNEPANWRLLPIIVECLAAVLVLRLRRLDIQVVSYAIENVDPTLGLANRLRLPLPVVRTLAGPLLRVISRGYDRVAFGTEGARETYAAAGLLRPEVLADARVFPALAVACDCPGSRDTEPTAVFLGTFDDRKGVEIALRAWGVSGAGSLGHRLLVLGQGPRRDEVLARAAQLPQVEVIEAPSREAIHAALRRASLLIAPSQRTGVWREQVGLPILEALSHGCTVLTSDETGIASWLADHGHRVLPALAPSADWAEALRGGLQTPLDPAAVIGSLPSRDTRLAAEDWLLRD